MIREERTEYPRDAAALINLYEDEAIRCCIDSWNQLCSEHPLTNATEVAHRKRFRFCGHNVAMFRADEICGEISKVAFEANKHLTAKALKENPDLPVMVLNCWTWWRCESGNVRGWIGHIEIDVAKRCVTQFPEIHSAIHHLELWPVP